MASDTVISTSGLSKAYRIWDRPSSRILSPIQASLASVFGQRTPIGRKLLERASSHYRDFLALNGVSFEVKRGESFGIIGRNGSGKSTLLQILAGTLRPTSGSFSVRGKVAALLELGSGFNPEFTGIENVILNGAILGVPRSEMMKRLKAVEEFADIGDFIHQPVKTYSSGMLVRLAFAVQTMVDPDILIIDEALSVGDVFFQQKCFRRLEELRERGTVIVLVSHGMNIIEQYCDRALLLHRGNVVSIGPSPEVIKQFYLIHRDASLPTKPRPRSAKPTNATNKKRDISVPNEWPEERAFFDISKINQVADGSARCLAVGLTDTAGEPKRRFEQGETAYFYYAYEILTDLETPVVGIVLFNNRGIIVPGKNTLEYGSVMPERVPAGTILRFRHRIKLELEVAFYTIEVGIASIAAHDARMADQFSHDDLTARVRRHCHLTGIGPFEVCYRLHGKPVQLLHHGIANLDGGVELLRDST
ncbi:MAG: ABC transporter ATP-binding protein [Verrucomicrobia bacterium]|nr:MAG: ABC transporter ATP-binding protein [Verrucomicrobiota bacterium]